MKKWLKVVWAALWIGWFLVGCGYKTGVAFTQKVLSDKINVDVAIYNRNPENAVLVKDALHEAVLSRFGAKLVGRQEATTLLHVRFENVSFRPIQYDTNGYAIFYRANVHLSIDYETPTSKGHERVNGFYDFPIRPRAFISEAMRYKAIKEGSTKALDAFISRMMLRGYRHDHSRDR